VTIHDGYDVVQESGQKIEFGELRKVTVSRPDRLRIEVERSDGQKGSVFFDGKDITVYTADKNIYATAPRQGTLDQAIRYALDDLKIRMPLALMLLSRLPTELDTLGVSADYVETTTVMDVPCDHLAARTAGGVDFQVWVAQGNEPLPRRIVITYKNENGQPQFWADLSKWNLAPDVSDALFSFTPPNGQSGFNSWPKSATPLPLPLLRKETTNDSQNPIKSDCYAIDPCFCSILRGSA
jgi:hypothetical protein